VTAIHDRDIPYFLRPFVYPKRVSSSSLHYC
jgi:hypothetical protein